MKNIFTVLFLLSGLISTQIGINTEDHTETLNINGSICIRTAEKLLYNTAPSLLTSSDDGVVKRLPSNVFSSKMTTLAVNTVFANTLLVCLPTEYHNFQLDILYKNTCNR